jgi:hypothetical protein
MSIKCVVVVSHPAGGGSLIAKTLMAMGFKAPGIPSDDTNDWNLVAVNQIMCDRAHKPKISLGMVKHAVEPMAGYIDDKIKEGQNWVMHDPMLCMTFFEFAQLLKEKGVDYKVIIALRKPHYSALEIVRSDKDWTLEEASSLLGKYIVARSLNTDRFYLENKEDVSRVLHLDVNNLLDDTDNAVELLAKEVGVELTDEAKEAIGKLLKPAS